MAERSLTEWLARTPTDPQAHFQFGEALRIFGDPVSAIAAYRQSLALDARSVEAHNNLASLLRLQGDLDGAIEHYRRAVELADQVGALHFNLAGTLEAAGNYPAAIQSYRQAILRAPQMVSAYNDAGQLLHATGALDEARGFLEQAVRIDPGHALAHANLATVLKDQGYTYDAYEASRTAVDKDASLYLGWTNLLYCLPYLSDVLQKEEIRQIVTAFGAAYRMPTTEAADTPVLSELRGTSERRERRLRVGYLSADFRDHAVSYFFEPVLEHHDRSCFEIYCYDLNPCPDAVTARLRRTHTVWRNCCDHDDEALAATLRQDELDVLVDLMGHTAGNRLPLFAQRLAPVQATWLGWPGTSAVPGIDYLIADPHVATGDDSPLCTSEQTLCLPDTWLCYRPAADAPSVAPAPEPEEGVLTFGSFNGVYKITPRVVRVWSEILKRLPTARLLIVGVPEGEAHERLIGLFDSMSIARSRLLLRTPLSLSEFFRLHASVDIALDTFPFNGGTTTLHSLWMGVPVVCMVGDTHAGRMGWSIMRNLDLQQLAASSEQDYIEIAARLAADRPQRVSLREGLRQRLRESPLMGEAGFTHQLEEAYIRIADAGHSRR